MGNTLHAMFCKDYYNAAVVEINKSNYNASVQYLRKALDINPRNVECVQLIGRERCYQRLRKP